MDRSEERAALEAVAFSTDDSTRAGERLRALELLAELRRADSPPPRTPTEQERIEHYADPDHLARAIELMYSQGLFDELIEERARELAAEMVRERFGVVEAGGEPRADQPAEESAEPSEELREPENIEQVAVVLDDQVQAMFPPEVLARQWPTRQPRSLSASVLHPDT